MKKIILILTMLFVTIFTFGNGEKVLKVGDKFPEVTFIKSNGEKVKLSSLKGKPVLINFTASWCPFCKEEKALFDKDYERSLKNSKDIETVVVFGDYGKETPETAAQYMRDNGYKFPYYYDKGRVILQEINLKKIPLNYFLDKDGKIVEISGNYHELNSLKPFLKK